MIAKNGDRIIITENGEDNFIHYNKGDTGVMVGKGCSDGEGGDVELDSGGTVYLFKSEYKVITEEVSKPTEVTAESLRNRFLEIEKEEEVISKKIDSLSEEKSKIEDDLRLMGFMLCSPVPQDFMPILDDSPEIDYTDWRNWKKGDMVECVNDKGWEGSFVSGGLYEVSSKSENCIWIMGEAGEELATYSGSDFKFHSPF